MNKLILIISSIILLACNIGYTTSQNNNILHQQIMDQDTCVKNINQIFNKINNMCNEFENTSFILDKNFPHYYEINNILKNIKTNTHDCLIHSYNPKNMINFYNNTINELQEILDDINENNTSGTNLIDENDHITENNIIDMTIGECEFLIKLNEQLLQLIKYRNEHFLDKINDKKIKNKY